MVYGRSSLVGNELRKWLSSVYGTEGLAAKCTQRDHDRLVVRFAITDTGVGIPEDRIDRLFSPFTQVDSSTTRHFGGTGLGLSICKQLAALMGGTIGVESRLGSGSTFWFELPFTVIADDNATAQRRQLLQGTRVLAVDGLDKDRRQVGDCLESWGCHVQQVATLPEAFDAIAQAETAADPFTVILADCRLAIGDEYVHLQKLAANPARPVIGLGAGESNDLAAHLHRLGLRQLLRDPVRPSALFNALTSVLSVTPPSVAAMQPAATDDQPSAVTGHILVAEDNHINQMFVRELLKHIGCTCDIANNGDEALTSVHEKHYDLVLMDCQMPEMDGFTAAREIRRREAAGELSGRRTIIALTANALKGDRERCLQAGMNDYLSKPLQAEQLQTMLAIYLATNPDDSSAAGR